jgi:hypothetical protein
MKKSVLTLLLLGSFVVAPAQYVTPVNKATLAVMREQQKLARDVYDSMHKVWGLALFEEIGSAEAAHMEAVKSLLDQFVVADPVAATGDTPGKFVHRRFQQLYDSLVVLGTASPEGAFRVGAFVEEMDIVDLQRAVQATSSSDLKAIYKYMVVGSERHLLAFSRRLKRLGVIYQPVLLRAWEYERLVGASGGGTE